MPAPRASIIFEAENSKFHQATNENLKDLDRTRAGANDVSRAVSGLVKAFVSYQTIVGLLRAAKTAETFENTRAAFNRYVSDGNAGLAQLQQATKNTVNDLKLLENANRALNAGLPFEVIADAMAFAEIQANKMEVTFEVAFNRIVDALSKLESGLGRNSGALLSLGLTAITTTGILEQMRSKINEAKDDIDNSSDAVAQYETRWENATLKIQQSIKKFLLPVLEQVSRIMAQSVEGSVDQTLSIISKRLQNSGDLYNELFRDSDKIGGLIKDMNSLREASLAGNLKDSDLEATLALISFLQQQGTLPEFAEDLAYARIELEKLLAARSKPVTNLSSGSPLLTTGEQQRLLDAQDEAAKAAKKAADEAVQRAKEAANILREKLSFEREEAKQKIQLGEATYAELSNILDRQKADNKDFFDQDKSAFLAWQADRVLVYQQDKANAAEILNAKRKDYDNYIADILASDKLSQEDKFRLAREATIGAQEEFKTNEDDVRKYYNQKMQIEQDYKNFLLESYNEQLYLLQNLFGQPALQFIDAFFTGAEVRFEDFLKNILRQMVQFLAQTAILRLFTAILGNPFGGSIFGGAPGGPGPTDFLPGASIPRLPDLTTLPASALNGAARAGAPQPAVFGGTVQILATKEQLYALVDNGREQYNRSIF